MNHCSNLVMKNSLGQQRSDLSATWISNQLCLCNQLGGSASSKGLQIAIKASMVHLQQPLLTSGVETKKYSPSCPLLYPVSHPDVMQGVEQVLVLPNGDEREFICWKRCRKQQEITLCQLLLSPLCLIPPALCGSGWSLSTWQ